ncbi:MAG: acyltransferase [Bowdeniella nasicola]|nr:acyltransferase [Bowdeniella nasicola]
MSQRAGRSPTLGEALSGRDNALNFMRLILAVAVIFGHIFPLGGFEPLRVGPWVYGGLHGQAVNGFFIISGYLILGSSLRQSTLSYFWRRFLRIYPGYLVAVICVAFLFAPLSTIGTGGTWDAGSAVSYVTGALDLKPSQEGVVGTLASVPWPETWNGSLWTLFYEFSAYIATGILVTSRVVRENLKATVLLLCGGLSLAYLLIPESVLGLLPGALMVVIGNGLRLGTYFTWGMLCYVYRDVIRPRPALVALAWLIFLLVQLTAVIPSGVREAVTFVALAYAVLGCGAVSSIRLGRTNDISYGIYIYAFPVQQFLILWGIARFGITISALTCLICTIPFALASWRWVEKPALDLKRLVPARPRVPEAALTP